LKLDTEKGFFPGAHKQRPFTDEEPLPVTSQHSTDAEETPTAETDRSETLRDVLDGPIDTKLQLIQHHAKMARLLAEEVLDEEVKSFAGERYSRKEDGNPFRRRGSNSGSTERGSQSTCLAQVAPTRRRSGPWTATRR
jgi:hypothetical protein